MFNKENVEMICKQYEFDFGKNLLYLYWNDISAHDNSNYSCIEESRTELIPHNGILEIKEYRDEIDSEGKEEEILYQHIFIPYESIISLGILKDS